jgi:predicted dehydrogenase
MLKGGIIGFGETGQEMIDELRQTRMAEIVAACNRGPEKLVIAREKYGLRTTHDPRELCSWDLDFVLVTSTSCAHREHVLAAAEAGLPMLIEKPIALNLKDADDMIEAVRKKSLVTLVNYTLRFQPACRRMKHVVDSGELGDVLSVTCYTSRGYGLYAGGARHAAVIKAGESGGWLVHHACHMVDFAMWLAGDVESAYCRSRTTVPGSDSPEVIWGMLALKTGGAAVIGDTVASMRQRIITVIGTKATIEMLRTPRGEVLHMRQERHEPFDLGHYDDDILAYGPEVHHQGLRDFIACVRENRKSPNDLASGRPSLAVCLAMEESRKTGKIVPLSRIEGR